MLRTIHLYGEMAERFGTNYKLDVEHLGEATHALASQIPGLRAYMMERHFQCVRGEDLSKGYILGEEEITFQGRGDFHIVPAIAGSKQGGLGKLIAGILLIGVAFWMGPTTAIFGSVTWGNVAGIGLAMALAGLSQLLTPQPKKKKKNDSFTFNGAVNTTDQGVPVPLVYGRTMTGSVVLSAGISADDYPISPDDSGK
jgi:predicted phage tail protein